MTSTNDQNKPIDSPEEQKFALGGTLVLFALFCVLSASRFAIFDMIIASMFLGVGLIFGYFGFLFLIKILSQAHS